MAPPLFAGAALGLAALLGLAAPARAVAAEPPAAAGGLRVQAEGEAGRAAPALRLARLGVGPFDPEPPHSGSGGAATREETPDPSADLPRVIHGPLGVEAGSGSFGSLGLVTRLPGGSVLRRAAEADRHWLTPLAAREHDLGLFLAAQSSLLIDMAQTMEIRQADGLSETNPLLGQAPQDAEVLAYFGSAAALHAIAYATLPGRWANVVSRAVLFVQLPAIDNNVRLGVAINF